MGLPQWAPSSQSLAHSESSVNAVSSAIELTNFHCALILDPMSTTSLW
jgi:hypothetical protein